MNPEIKRLIEARQKAWAAMREVSDRAATEGRDFTAEEEASWQRGNAELDAMDARLQAVVELEQRDADIAATLERYGAAESRDEATTEAAPSDSDVLRAMGRGERRSADFGPAAAESRVLSGLTAAAGANTVPTGFYETLIEALRETSTVLAANAMLVQTESGNPIQVPTAASANYPAAALVAEAGTIGVSEPTFGQTTIGAYKYAFLAQVSSELLADNAVNVVEFLARRGGEALGNGIGAAFISGTGSSQPTGIVGTNGFTSVAAAGGSVAAGFSYNDVLTLVHSITRPYRANASFICNDSVTLQLRRLREGTGTGQFLWQPSLQAGQPDVLSGYPIFTDPAMPTAQTNGTKGLAFGDWNKGLMVRIAGGVRIESSADYAFNTDLMTWRFITRADSRIVDAAAARVLTYAT
jgi:HK97 family phage major capsid protein